MAVNRYHVKGSGRGLFNKLSQHWGGL